MRGWSSTEENGAWPALEAFKARVSGQEDAALIVADTYSKLKSIKHALRQLNFQGATDALSTLNVLAQGESAYITIAPPLDMQIYCLLCQYGKRPGVIQLMDSTSFELTTTMIDPTSAHLVLLTTADDLHAIERRHRVNDKVGVIERF